MGTKGTVRTAGTQEGRLAGSIAFVVQFCGAYVRLWCSKIKNIQT